MLPFTDERREALRARVRAFASGLPRRSRAGGDAPDRQAVREAATALASQGLLALLVPAAHGGAQPTVEALSLAVVREELAHASPLHDSVFAVQGLAASSIAAGATPALAAQVLPRLASGEALGAFAVTEPEAGSDVSSLTTCARRQGDGWILDGHKTFISHAGLADETVVFARVKDAAPELAPDSGGDVVAFVVPAAAPGFDATPIEMMGAHAVGSLRLRGVWVANDRMLGGPGDGLGICLRTLELFRPTVGASACGLARRALDEALRRTRVRRQFGRPLVDHQSVAFALAEMATELEAARGLVYRAAWEREGAAPGARRSLTASMAKLFATEAAQRIVDRSLQLHGAAGLVRGGPLEALYREVRALRIYEGTSEIQKLVIARELGR